MTVTLPPLRSGLAAAAALITLVACSGADRAVSPTPKARVNLAIRPAGSVGTPLPGTLHVNAVRLVIASASLGANGEFGCRDCQGNFEDANGATTAPTLVVLNGTAGPVTVMTGETAPGSYATAELDIQHTATPVIGSSRDTTIEITGTSNGVPFTLRVAAAGGLVLPLSPPVQITSTAAGPVTATLDLPVASWFTGAAGALDPNVAPQRAQVIANIVKSLSPADSEAPSTEAAGGEG